MGWMVRDWKMNYYTSLHLLAEMAIPLDDVDFLLIPPNLVDLFVAHTWLMMLDYKCWVIGRKGCIHFFPFLWKFEKCYLS